MKNGLCKNTQRQVQQMHLVQSIFKMEITLIMPRFAYNLIPTGCWVYLSAFFYWSRPCYLFNFLASFPFRERSFFTQLFCCPVNRGLGLYILRVPLVWRVVLPSPVDCSTHLIWQFQLWNLGPLVRIQQECFSSERPKTQRNSSF